MLYLQDQENHERLIPSGTEVLEIHRSFKKLKGCQTLKKEEEAVSKAKLAEILGQLTVPQIPTLVTLEDQTGRLFTRTHLM